MCLVIDVKCTNTVCRLCVRATKPKSLNPSMAKWKSPLHESQTIAFKTVTLTNQTLTQTQTLTRKTRAKRSIVHESAVRPWPFSPTVCVCVCFLAQVGAWSAATGSALWRPWSCAGPSGWDTPPADSKRTCSEGSAIRSCCRPSNAPSATSRRWRIAIIVATPVARPGNRRWPRWCASGVSTTRAPQVSKHEGRTRGFFFWYGFFEKFTRDGTRKRRLSRGRLSKMSRVWNAIHVRNRSIIKSTVRGWIKRSSENNKSFRDRRRFTCVFVSQRFTFKT